MILQCSICPVGSSKLELLWAPSRYLGIFLTLKKHHKKHDYLIRSSRKTIITSPPPPKKKTQTLIPDHVITSSMESWHESIEVWESIRPELFHRWPMTDGLTVLRSLQPWWTLYYLNFLKSWTRSRAASTSEIQDFKHAWFLPLFTKWTSFSCVWLGLVQR